jgi:hypothetical protein
MTVNVVTETHHVTACSPKVLSTMTPIISLYTPQASAAASRCVLSTK